LFGELPTLRAARDKEQVVDNDQERRVRERAHAIWEREGRPGARHHDHWHRAVQELEAEEAAAIGPAGSGSGMAGTSPSGGASDTGSGLSSGLQPGGTTSGGGTGASVGSLGTGGGSTSGAATGTPSRRGS
jgi:hypothetical protein